MAACPVSPTATRRMPRFLNAELENTGVCMAEYIWIGGAPHEFFSCVDMRSKTKVLASAPKSVKDLPIWNYDGSSTNQAPGSDSEVLLKPVALFKDPIRKGNNVMVLCETMDPNHKPLPTNTRAACAEVMEKAKEQVPWFGLEQEYTLFREDERTPLGFPERGLPKRAQGPYYCGSGTGVQFGRDVVEEHLTACVYAGLKVAGINAEVMPGQWEIQIGPCTGIEEGDHLWMARYLLQRITEKYTCTFTLDPKPMTGDWNGAGLHTNYSTKAMREKGGMDVIIKAIEKLGARHTEFMKAYGEGNDRRLTGAHETAPIDKFSYGVANRGASVRIPREAENNGCGYFEDRRPASNADPYVVTKLIVEATCL